MTPSPATCAAPHAAIHIALAANHRYIKGLKATLLSIVESAAEKNRLCFHIFSDGLTEEDKAELAVLARKADSSTPLDIRETDTSPIAAKFKPHKGGYTTFLRIFLPDFLKDLEWVIWVDVDTLWFRDVARLWNEQQEDVSLVWCHDISSTMHVVHSYAKWNPDFDDDEYGCAGVVMMNLKRLRENNFVNRAAAFVEKWGTPFFCDQDILNFCCYKDTKFVDDRWDCLNPDPDWQDGIVLHFNGLGAHFNDLTFTGWRPLCEIWFRYYAQKVEGRSCVQVCPWWKRCFFNLLGLVYVPRRLIALLPISIFHIDNLHRTIFFAWIRRKRLWK